jgi:hypothetical protein
MGFRGLCVRSERSSPALPRWREPAGDRASCWSGPQGGPRYISGAFEARLGKGVGAERLTADLLGAVVERVGRTWNSGFGSARRTLEDHHARVAAWFGGGSPARSAYQARSWRVMW